ncbi:TRAP transporter small permease [Pelagibius litoralis]|uniref:TRAP transporter small permease protein n=1 Tax=Pelagibius litoralis TaxID=374515 RepID=A0A967C2W4_9PROT|nr:TRAP transporter small permease [Pelagibius litoralis]NIA68678.1 TRAP transporter small permease [Pelagibius litoralis]
MIKLIDTLSELTGKLAAWMFFAIGLFVTYEVVMRYVFTLPTIWVDEVSRILQIWATCLAGAFVLKHRGMITIEVAFKDPTTLARKLVESFALLTILLFCGVACWYGFDLWLKATRLGHTTDSFLATPKWVTHGSIWVGFGLLMIQAFVEMARIWTGGMPVRGGDDGLENRLESLH